MNLAVTVAVAVVATAEPQIVQMFTNDKCTGSPNITVDLSNSSYNNCKNCWDHCASNPKGGIRAYRFLGSGTVAINENCVGVYGYSGGWSDPSIGGTFSKESGCISKTGSAIILCSGSIPKLQDDLDEVCGHPIAPPPDYDSHRPFYVLNASDYKSHLGKDLTWASKNTPFIDLPMDDILTSFYYRWREYKKHLKYSSDGFVLTEFLPYVPWSGRHNTIPAAAGHHILEGRWLHNPKVMDDYILFWYRQTHDSPAGDPTTYTNWIGHAAWQRYLVTGNSTFLETLMPLLAKLYETKYTSQYLRNYTASSTDGDEKQCWFQNDGSDAMEVSISGSGCRPTMASAMFGEAAALVQMGILLNDSTVTKQFETWRDFSRNVVLEQHWNIDIGTFAVIPVGKGVDSTTTAGSSAPPAARKTARLSSSQDPVSPTCNSTVLNAVRAPNKTVDVRELLAFMPWYYGSSSTSTATADGEELLIPPSAASKYMGMWTQLFDDKGFQGPWGLRSAEFRHVCYNYSWEHGDCWNGPSWPYETARVLTAAANVLNEYQTTTSDAGTPRSASRTGSATRSSGANSADDDVGANGFALTATQYVGLLMQYARQHTKTTAINDTASPLGSGHLFENLHADLGYWNNRQRKYWSNDENDNMGDDYNHSTFIDLILSGLFGLRPKAGNVLEVYPLLLQAIREREEQQAVSISPNTRSSSASGGMSNDPLLAVDHFAVDHVLYKERVVSVVYDKMGGKYYGGKFKAGLTVLVDGKEAAYSSTGSRLVVKF
jgi:hypothetical protein